MPHHCIVFGCTNNSKVRSDLSFHCLPLSNPQLLNVWFNKIKRDKRHVARTSSSKVCSEHFTKNDFTWTGDKLRRLKSTAVPSKFIWTKSDLGESSNSSDSEEERPSIKKRRKFQEELEEETDTASEGECNVMPGRPNMHSQSTQWKEEDCNVQVNDKTLPCSHTFSTKHLLSKCKTKKMEFEYFMHFTGMYSYQRFKDFLSFVCPVEDNDDIIYWGSSASKKKLIDTEELFNQSSTSEVSEKESEDELYKNRLHRMSVEDELLLTLMKLRTGASNIDLAERFNITKGCVSYKVISWINLMYVTLGSLKIWPHRDIVLKNAPKEFKKKYSNTIIIIDATELIINVPSSLQKQSECYSHYKHHTTLKALIGVDAMGGIMFISQLFEGAISDKELVKRSGFLNLLEMKLKCGEILQGDSIMADRGFNIEEELEKLGLKLNVPPFLKEKGSFGQDDVIRTQTIARHRIHVERAIGKVKRFRIFQSQIPVSMFGTINQIWTVACLISNFQNPVVSENE